MTPDAHTTFIEQIDAYLDGELDREGASRVEDHLLSCARCRRSFGVHRAIRSALSGRDTAAVAPDSLRMLIQEDIASARARQERRHDRHWLLPWTGWLAAALVGLTWMLAGRGFSYRRPVPTPMARSVIADFDRHQAEPLPHANLVSLETGFNFPVTPLPALRRQLVAEWRTQIQGQPAAALAYRLPAGIVVEYVISRGLFFRQPEVRNAVARSGRYVAQARAVTVVGWPASHAGVLLVGRVKRSLLESLAM